MADSIDEMAGSEQVKIILNTLYLCIEFAMRHVAEHQGVEAASDLKGNMLRALKHGDIDMALLENARTFDLLIPKIEQLTWPSRPEAAILAKLKNVQGTSRSGRI